MLGCQGPAAAAAPLSLSLLLSTPIVSYYLALNQRRTVNVGRDRSWVRARKQPSRHARGPRGKSAPRGVTQALLSAEILTDPEARCKVGIDWSHCKPVLVSYILGLQRGVSLSPYLSLSRYCLLRDSPAEVRHRITSPFFPAASDEQGKWIGLGACGLPIAHDNSGRAWSLGDPCAEE